MKRSLLLGLWLASAAFACGKKPAPLPADARAEPPAHLAAAGPVRVREPAAAGQFYPADPAALRLEVQKLVGSAKRQTSSPVRTVLMPHAGYRYSGAVAAAAAKQIEPGFERVVIVAANHNADAHFSGVSVDTATHYRVPGAEVKVAAAARDLLARSGFVDVPAAHSMHMIEIEIPFLAEVNTRPFEIVPLIVGQISRAEGRNFAAELARLLDARTRVVFSIDLSHYHPYDEAVRMDTQCLAAIEQADSTEIERCVTDATPLLAVMNHLAVLQGTTPRQVMYANSGDTSGDKSRVVGYGAVAYEDVYRLGAREQQAILDLAQKAVHTQVREGRQMQVPPDLLARLPRLGTTLGAFVTLKKHGELRGCIGTLKASQPLADDVVSNAVNAAIRDPRFSPMRPDELGDIAVSVSVLDVPRPLTGVTGEALAKKLGAEHPGLIIEFEGRRSTFLPQVWDELPEPTEFLGHLCRKQGSPANCWREAAARFESYGAQVIGEGKR
jgi:AmmeMemoRadiSam system protein B/AmmeMemoRadiSam system protein A